MLPVANHVDENIFMELGAEFRRKQTNFRLLLTSGKRLLSILADMERADEDDAARPSLVDSLSVASSPCATAASPASLRSTGSPYGRRVSIECNGEEREECQELEAQNLHLHSAGAKPQPQPQPQSDARYPHRRQFDHIYF
jgi:hypothetical protein